MNDDITQTIILLVFLTLVAFTAGYLVITSLYHLGIL